MTNLEKALFYAKAGIAVIPCEPANKEPIWALVPKDIGPDRKPIPRTGGVKKATRDPVKIAEWWGMRPDAMIGGATGEASGFWAVDPDMPKPKKNGHAGEFSPDGAAAWEKLKAEYGGHAQTVEVTTPSGGRHVYFRCDPARPSGNREGNLSGLGINVRGNGGYVILPPSRRWPDGKAYEATRPFAPGAIAEAPAWLYDLIRRARKQPTPGTFPCTPENERNLRDALSTIPADARDMWLKIGGALHALGPEWNGTARRLWDEWSLSEPGSFDPEDQDATWQGFDPAHPNGATVGTIFFEARERGYAPHGELGTLQFSEDQLATSFTLLHEDDLRYVAPWSKWYRWNGSHWEHENTLAAFDMARKVCREAARQCNKPSEAKNIVKAKTVAAVEQLARSDRTFVATIQQWDVDKCLFNSIPALIVHTAAKTIAPKGHQ